ncbi:MAG: transposase [Ginsengibacter sp.]
MAALGLACKKHGCDIHAYGLMTHHVHLFITPHQEHGLGKALQMLGRYYVQYYNYRYQRTGTLWEGRYKRRAAYRQLFKHAISAKNMSEIREAINKAWVLGDARFKQEIQKRVKRRVEPTARGGDRRSEQFKINRV